MRFLLQPRWLAFTLIAALSVPVCVLMGVWQLQRFADQREAGTVRSQAQNLPPVPLADLLAPGEKVTLDDRGRQVTVTGTYDPAHQLVVPRRDLDGATGSYIVTPLRSAGGHAVVVNRGWIPGTPDVVPAPPAGTVTVTGRLEMSEAEHTSKAERAAGLRPGQISMINTPELVNAIAAYPLYDGFVALTEQVPAASGDLVPMPPGTEKTGGGMTKRAWQNLGYTLQWFVFAGAVVLIWWRVVKREADERRARHEREVRRALGIDDDDPDDPHGADDPDESGDRDGNLPGGAGGRAGEGDRARPAGGVPGGAGDPVTAAAGPGDER